MGRKPGLISYQPTGKNPDVGVVSVGDSVDFFVESKRVIETNVLFIPFDNRHSEADFIRP